MKVYSYSIVIFIFVCSLFGYVLPKLFSAKSDTAFFIAVLILIALPVVLFWMIKKLIKPGVKNEKI